MDLKEALRRLDAACAHRDAEIAAADQDAAAMREKAAEVYGPWTEECRGVSRLAEIFSRQRRVVASAEGEAARATFVANALLVDDPQVTWVMRNVYECHPGEAMRILRALPVTLDDLDRMAETDQWCGYDGLPGVWPGFRQRALKDGVITEAPAKGEPAGDDVSPGTFESPADVPVEHSFEAEPPF